MLAQALREAQDFPDLTLVKKLPISREDLPDINVPGFVASEYMSEAQKTFWEKFRRDATLSFAGFRPGPGP